MGWMREEWKWGWEGGEKRRGRNEEGNQKEGRQEKGAGVPAREPAMKQALPSGAQEPSEEAVQSGSGGCRARPAYSRRYSPVNPPMNKPRRTASSLHTSQDQPLLKGIRATIHSVFFSPYISLPLALCRVYINPTLTCWEGALVLLPATPMPPIPVPHYPWEPHAQ